METRPQTTSKTVVEWLQDIEAKLAETDVVRCKLRCPTLGAAVRRDRIGW